MRETKLISLLQHFESDEFKAFDKFIQSPYFNTNETLTKLWFYLRKYTPNFDAPQLANEKVFKKLFPKITYNEKKLRQLRSQLFKLIEEFLAIEQIKKEKKILDKKLAQAYYEKELFEYSHNIYLKIIDQTSSNPYVSLKETKAQINSHHQLYFSQLANNRDLYPIHLSEATRFLEIYYWQKKLFYAIEWFSRNTRYQEEMPLSIQQLKSAILEDKLRLPPNNKAIDLYLLFCKKYLARDALQTNQLFFTIKQELTTNYQNISDYDKHWMIKQLINYGVKQLNANTPLTITINWEQEIFNLYRLGLSDSSILHKGKMTETTFMNIVYQACRLQEFDWLAQFLTNTAQKLINSQPANYIRLAKSYAAFFQGKFEECLQLTSNISLKDSSITEINRRSLQIRAAFECYLINPIYQPILISFIDSYNKYLIRNTILSTQKKQIYFNLNLMIKKLTNWLTSKQDMDKLLRLKKQLNDFDIFSKVAKEWLLHHINNFEKGNIPKDIPKRLIKY